MNEPLKFTKMQGLGNDYVYVNGFSQTVNDPAALARRISDRHFGIGSDGLVLILPSRTQDVRMRVWERGTGETLACGTGACAAAVASFLNGRTGRIVEVELRGGLLRIKWDETDGHVYMTGPAATVYDGTFYM